MLRKTNDLLGCTFGARDGEVGRAKDLYFEDQHWVIRYLVADTRKWLPGRKVLLSPFAVKGIHEENHRVDLDLSREQIENSPSIERERPISRQYELQYYRYYNWPFYWQGAGIWGPLATPDGGFGQAGIDPRPEAFEPSGDPHLRSTRELAGYYLHGRDADIGHVEDLVFDDHDWAIRYLLVDTRNWWPGKRVLVSVDWVRSINFDRTQVDLDLDRGMVKSAPEYDDSQPITREFETRLFEHYRREPYWMHQLAA